jgi:tRNA-specific 2-thiouridylase
MLDQAALRRTLFPVGDHDKVEIRRIAAELGLRTATKPDSQDVCFITSTGGRATFLGDRIPFRPGRVVDTDGDEIGSVPSIEMVTIGQRRGVGSPGGGHKRYVIDVDVAAGVVTVGSQDDLDRDAALVGRITWVGPAARAEAFAERVLVQCSAHAVPLPATLEHGDDLEDGSTATGTVRVVWAEPQRRVAPGQSVVFYDPTDERVLGGGTVMI